MSLPADTPLTLVVAVQSWRLDVAAVLLIVGLGVGYARCPRMGRGPTSCFVSGLIMWALATSSVIAVYAPVLFWMRAVQVLMSLFVVPFLLALGRPVSALRAALAETGRVRLDRLLSSRACRLAFSPLITSIAMLGVPWLLYLTPWYVMSMTGAIASLTRIALVIIGFGYFYARLQADPVPRRYPPLLSIGISVVESLGDGLLGLVLWLGPLIAVDYYAGLHRDWGPGARVDQSIGAGILWIVGDVLGIPFLAVLMRGLSKHEKARATEVDAELEDTADAPAPALWWEADPQLGERFGRR
ncbi:cytochrome c oxidase assembly protein [Mycolicibacterium hodleri]|uniref:Cytochrome c oxidase assembly protein n=1 Tax=Mycolicibacterium hodleri TaxID=49897 RepID=A0A502DYX6_9MYCO|nr:cytochrome c oxidase assembly protein [Mycolicibacterium hodleri]TPG29869.1 cytochrome c oxidase assembly protein [Mycolicibacterium hodleri]